MERRLKAALGGFKDQPNHYPSRLQIDKTLSLTLIRAGKPHPTFFVPGGSAEGDSGEHVVSEMARNLRICIDQKSTKVVSFRERYPEWWLVLEDRIGYGVLGDSDREQLRQLVQAHEPWSRVILVNPLDPSLGFELRIQV